MEKLPFSVTLPQLGHTVQLLATPRMPSYDEGEAGLVLEAYFYGMVKKRHDYWTLRVQNVKGTTQVVVTEGVPDRVFKQRKIKC